MPVTTQVLRGQAVSEFATLHPYDPAFIGRYVAALRGELAPETLLPSAPAWAAQEIARAQRGYARARTGDEMGANIVTHSLARLLAATQPIYLLPGAGLTHVEARYDRGIGMLLRPPSRLFGDAGLEQAAARAMPIRLDASGGSMGGAFMPPALTAQFRDQVRDRMERMARRMAEADLDAPAYVGLYLEVADYVADRGLGLYEAADVIVPGVAESEPPGMQLLQPSRKRLPKELRQQLETAIRPPKEPGLLARLFGRGAPLRPREIDLSDPRVWRGINDVTPPPPLPPRDDDHEEAV